MDQLIFIHILFLNSMLNIYVSLPFHFFLNSRKTNSSKSRKSRLQPKQNNFHSPKITDRLGLPLLPARVTSPGGGRMVTEGGTSKLLYALCVWSLLYPRTRCGTNLRRYKPKPGPVIFNILYINQNLVQ